VSQVSLLARDLDRLVADFRRRSLEAGPYVSRRRDTLPQKVRERGSTIDVDPFTPAQPWVSTLVRTKKQKLPMPQGTTGKSTTGTQHGATKTNRPAH
jgi:hypothetical protein